MPYLYDGGRASDWMWLVISEEGWRNRFDYEEGGQFNDDPHPWPVPSRHAAPFGEYVNDADDQRWLTRAVLRDPTRVMVDARGELFVALHSLRTHDVWAQRDGVVMRMGGLQQRPVLIHGNGHGKGLWRNLARKMGYAL